MTAPATASDSNTITVRHTDGRAETVHVREIPSEAFDAYARVLPEVEFQDGELKRVVRCREFEEAGFYVNREAKWAASLDSDSLDRVLRAGQRLNLQRLSEWLTRMADRMEALREKDRFILNAAAILENRPDIKATVAAAKTIFPPRPQEPPYQVPPTLN